MVNLRSIQENDKGYQKLSRDKFVVQREFGLLVVASRFGANFKQSLSIRVQIYQDIANIQDFETHETKCISLRRRQQEI